MAGGTASAEPVIEAELGNDLEAGRHRVDGQAVELTGRVLAGLRDRDPLKGSGRGPVRPALAHAVPGLLSTGSKVPDGSGAMEHISAPYRASPES